MADQSPARKSTSAAESTSAAMLTDMWQNSWASVGAGLWNAMIDYAVDSVQRTILYCDVMRQRGNQYLEHQAQTVPHVLTFDFQPVADGRRLPRPVNYGLIRIVPKPGTYIDEKKRPFVVVDPRAGHGPGIGGFKADSEIGVALRAGHPCYFIGFAPEPQPGQTLHDVLVAIGTFIQQVGDLHPDADGKPTVVGNCQAGWAVMMVAAIRPELFGPILVAGSPMSYWAGVRGANPMRYTGGLLGGSWLTNYICDLGNGTFDGAWLVQNFETLNPANTLWTKQYKLYANIDTEGPRYLEFEKWWGGHTLMNAAEIQYIVDELFVGNKLSTGQIRTDDGVRIDLRAIRGPIIVFCSKGDNITPPQQALGWITDLYRDVDDIRAHGQTIVYTVHESVGHLGIFVSGGVARKEHDEFASNIDLIDVLPPGLYEATFTETRQPGGEGGRYIATFLPRTLDDIRGLGGNDIEDERRFAAAARVSEATTATYGRFVSPVVRAWMNDAVAEAMRRYHPLRVQYELLSDQNPLMAAIAQTADVVRANRRSITADNPFLRLERALSAEIEIALNSYRDNRDRLMESAFLTIYGSPWLQSLVGVGPSRAPRQRPGDSADQVAFVRRRIAERRERITAGGPREAAIRAMIYCGMADPTFDERAFAVLTQIRAQQARNVTLAEFKELVRDQYHMLLIDEARALAAIPDLIGRQPDAAQKLVSFIERVLTARGPMSREREVRLARIVALMKGKTAVGLEKKPRSVA